MPVTPTPCGRAYKGFPRHHKQLGSSSRASGCLERNGSGSANLSQVVWVVDEWNDGLRHDMSLTCDFYRNRPSNCDCCQAACQRSAG